MTDFQYFAGTSPRNHDSAGRSKPEGESISSTMEAGTLQGNATLVIQTRQAQRLMKGRPKRGRQAGIPGLYPFSGRMRAIWSAARAGDPHAEGYLAQVLETIEQTRTELSRMREPLQERLHSVTGIEIHVAQSTAPVRIPLRFGTPYGYMGAYLISDFDQLVCTILTIQHVGLLAKDDGRPLIASGSRLIRRVFTIPMTWKPLAATRDDRRQNGPPVQSRWESKWATSQALYSLTSDRPKAPKQSKGPIPDFDDASGARYRYRSGGTRDVLIVQCCKTQPFGNLCLVIRKFAIMHPAKARSLPLRIKTLLFSVH